MPQSHPLRTAADVLIRKTTGKTLAELLEEERALAASYAGIARRIEHLTGGAVVVTAKTVQRWHETLRGAAA